MSTWPVASEENLTTDCAGEEAGQESEGVAMVAAKKTKNGTKRRVGGALKFALFACSSWRQ